MTAINPGLRIAVAGVVAWYDELLDGRTPSIIQLQHALDDLRHAGPFPPGPITDDVNRLLKPGPASARSDAIEAIERLRSAARNDGHQLRLITDGGQTP